MNWQFVGFTLLLVFVIYLHFALAHRELRAVKVDEPLEINWKYVQVEDYFGQSFRQKLVEWLKLPRTVVPGTGEMLLTKGAEQIRFGGSLNYQPDTNIDDILAINGDFTCQVRCTLGREVYVNGNCTIGEASMVQAIAVDGNLDLGPGANVMRWADSVGLLSLAAGSRVRSRATSRTAVELGPLVEVASAYAPRVSTADLQDRAPISPAVGDAMLTIPLDGPGAQFASSRKTGETRATTKRGFDPHKLYQITPDCWLYKGDLELTAPLNLKTKLIVRGHFSCPGGSILEGDIKANGSLHIGQGSTCMGNVVARGDVVLGPGTDFVGVVHAGRRMWLSSGVRGGAANALVAAYAVKRMYVATDVVVHGKISAGDRVVATPFTPSAGNGPEPPSNGESQVA